MFKLDQKGLIQFLVILILSAGAIATVWLVTAGPLKFFPRALSGPIPGPISTTPTPRPSSRSSGSYLVKPYLVYPADKPMYPEYETAVTNYLLELQKWYLDKVGITFKMAPLKVIRSSYNYNTMRCDPYPLDSTPPSSECLNDPKRIDGNWGYYMNVAIHNGVEKWDEQTATLVFSVGGGGFAGANKQPNDASWAIVGDWVLEPISGKVNDWGIPCKYSHGWECSGGTPKGTPIHELGHTFGLGHPPSASSIMNSHWLYPTVSFLPAEITYLKASPFFTNSQIGFVSPPSGTSTSTPTPIPTPTQGSVSGPITTKMIKDFRFAESPVELQSALWQPYSQGIVVSHTFSNSTPSLKFIFIQFRDNTGGIVKINDQEYILSSIELVAEGGPVSGPISLPTCTDSDGGRNYEVKGKVTYTNNPNGVVEEYDNCTSNDLLAERVCNSTTDYTKNTESYRCPYGCEDGACKPAPGFTSTPSQGPVQGPGGGGGGGQPPPRIIGQFRFAENPTDLKDASWQAYTPGVAVSHTFSDSTPGVKFIFIQFRDIYSQMVKINGQDYISSSIELVAELANCSSISIQGSTATVAFSGKPASLKIWVASNSEIGKQASNVSSWTQVKTVSNPQSGGSFTIDLAGFSAGSHAVLMSLHDTSGQMLDGNLGEVVNPKCASSLDIAGTPPGGQQPPIQEPPPSSTEACRADCKACPAINDRCGNRTYEKCDYSSCTSPDAQYRCYTLANPNCEGFYRCGDICGTR